MSMRKAAASTITPFLWFNGNAEEAVDFYSDVFPDSKKSVGAEGPGGKPITMSFELLGLSFIALNGDRDYHFNNSISFMVTCRDQAEIDHYWTKLTEGGGKEGHCGWLTDRFGLAWQVVPRGLGEMLRTPGAMAALRTMKKLNISVLEAAS